MLRDQCIKQITTVSISLFFFANRNVAVNMSSISRREQNQEMDLAFAANDRQNAEIFVLDIDCLWEIFDYISVADLCAMGMTCKRFHRAAGRYFNQNYPFETLSILRRRDRKVIQSVDCVETNFAEYARTVEIFIDTGVYRYAAAHKFPNMKIIEFSQGHNFSDDDIACIAQIDNLKNVETIKLIECSSEFTDALLNCILPFCTALKNLILDSSYMVDSTAGAKWKYQHYPTLERFGVLQTHDHLQTVAIDFFRANPQIKKLAAWDLYGGDLSDRIRTSGIQLDELEYRGQIHDEIRDEIIALNAEGFVNCLKFDNLVCTYRDGRNLTENLQDLNWFTSAAIHCHHFGECPQHNATTIGSLVSLKKLCLTTVIPLDQAELLSDALVNLEELHLVTSSLLALPFARRLPKLRVITVRVDFYSRSLNFVTDLNALNNARRQLQDAEVLQIYLEDEAYRQIRWTSIYLFLDLVQVRRFRYQGDEYW